MASSSAIWFYCYAFLVASVMGTVLNHQGGGLTSTVMREIVRKLPPAPEPTGPIRNATLLMRTINLAGDYLADVPIVLPSYTRLVLNGTMRPTLTLGTNGSDMPQGNL